ncbi:MAG: bifunctional homocysteine S-methyltransferase/methylenetetrahydrofolate reductase, partial [Bdellovibrionales bacterium]|nr:bifunctional homocysteine S-methyltransferase/methylenetetrahydrofolate reductase [Bdellovibrionales bacterium]
IQGSLKIARSVSDGLDVKVALSMGPMGDLLEPLGAVSLKEAEEEFANVARLAVEAGSPDIYIFETFTNIDELLAAIRGVRSVDTKTPIIASMHLNSSQDSLIQKFARLVGGSDDVQALGLNCSEGPSDIFHVMKRVLTLTNKPVIVQPNAGLPRQVNGRYFYMTSPDYLAKFAKRFVEAGAIGVGGCCGTGPDHIRAIRNSVSMANARKKGEDVRTPLGTVTGDEHTSPGDVVRFQERGSREKSRVLQLLSSKTNIVSVEILPPRGVDIAKFETQILSLEKQGVHFVNVPDGARASTRISSLHLAANVARNPGRKIRVLPHFTTRDRNLIALQSDLLGVAVNGVHDLLLVTGDPPKLGTNRDATAVYDIDSIGLTYLVDCLNRGVSPNGEDLGSRTEFGIGVASNPTAISLELEGQRWGYKYDMGADYAVTQPVFDPEAFLRWKDRIGTKYKPHLIGIWPLVSLRNAEFMANEVPGVSVPKWAIEEMAKAGTDKEECIKRGIEIAARVINTLKSEAEGFVISAPLGKVDVAQRLIDITGILQGAETGTSAGIHSVSTH